MNKSTYIKEMYNILAPMCLEKGYYLVAAGMIAQSIQEGWNSKLATEYHNYWGMKTGSGYKGKTVFMDNKQKTDPAVYRAYSNMKEGCQGYFEFLSYPRYRKLRNCATDIDFLNNIGVCGWNSNPGYGYRCISHLASVYEALVVNVHDVYYEKGYVYTLAANMYIRQAPEGDHRKYDDITENAKLNGYADDNGYAILKKGTRVTCLDVYKVKNSTWILIPSGWICGKTDIKTYVM